VNKIKALCPSCEVIYNNANQDSNAQQAQAESALTNGAKVMILDAVDGKAAQSIVQKANSQHVPVISYDRLASGPVDYYISFDNEVVGKTQGKGLLDALKKGGDPKRGKVVMINGDPADPNAADFKKGAHSVLDGAVTLGREYDTPTWAPDKAQDEMTQAITALGKNNIVGVYAANDGTAGGAIAAMKAAGFKPIPPTTGQDAELAAIQRILIGDQAMTVYKAIKPEADAAAAMAVAAGQGKTYDQATAKKNNGTKDVPSQLLTPVAVTKDNVKDTVIKDGFIKPAQLCTGQYAAACKSAGIS
jgi:D-xylose transport system substrate-binding protein